MTEGLFASNRCAPIRLGADGVSPTNRLLGDAPAAAGKPAALPGRNKAPRPSRMPKGVLVGEPAVQAVQCGSGARASQGEPGQAETRGEVFCPKDIAELARPSTRVYRGKRGQTRSDH